MEPNAKLDYWLRMLSIGVAMWGIVFSIAQLLWLGLTYADLNDRRKHYDDMHFPFFGVGIDPYRQSMPGLYERIIEMPERKRFIALQVLHIILMVLSAVTLLVSMLLFFGSAKCIKNCVWPWPPAAALLSLVSVIYAITWFFGYPYGVWLKLAYFEFLTAVPVNAICIAIVVVHFLRLRNTDAATPQQLDATEHTEKVEVNSPYTYHPQRLVSQTSYHCDYPAKDTYYNQQYGKQFAHQYARPEQFVPYNAHIDGQQMGNAPLQQGAISRPNQLALSPLTNANHSLQPYYPAMDSRLSIV